MVGYITVCLSVLHQALSVFVRVNCITPQLMVLEMMGILLCKLSQVVCRMLLNGLLQSMGSLVPLLWGGGVSITANLQLL